MALVVLAMHLAALWGLQRGLAGHPPETIVPVQLLQAVLAPPVAAPVLLPASPPAATQAPAHPIEPWPRHQVLPPRPPVVRSQPMPHPVPQPPQAAPAPAPTPARAPPAPAAPAAPATAAPAPAAAHSPAATAAPAAPPPPRIELPVSDADYLQNPQPEWPRRSQELGEHGVVLLRVLIGVDGRAHKVEIVRSSSYPRLDRAARDAVLQWRFVPGKRGGVPEEMSYQVPIRWGE